jgi:NADH dehydrogenase FAD-containing subunit
VLAASAPLPLRPALAQSAAGRVVVIGGGFAGATLGITHRRRKADSNRRSSPGMSWSFSQECECELGDKDGLECVVHVAGTKGSNPLSSTGESSELGSRVIQDALLNPRRA